MVEPVETPAPTDWYRTAVFYEVLLRAFSDSTSSGTGDIRGLINKLDYLQWLGVDCLWLPPFYPSPLRDGGYDVADFTSIDPRYGTENDFKELIDEAHKRGLRLIIDIVMNHTSDQHPWFQASRSEPDGPYGDYYVWRDDASEYSEARIIFIDTEESNWTYDPVRKQYFWHRFFSHQPDLNFENPQVRAAMLDVSRFWLNLGVDGFRLDAVPYLYEAEGTNGENLPATHEFLAELRAMVDTEYPGRILLAEANQWPADVIEYFGTDDAPECHLCFHFPVMPRIYYALKDQSAAAIRQIMADTPPIPTTGGQWSTFLRNHDELTLEMVSDDERAQMYQWYAPEPRMKANVGIRRRLAPLLDNSSELLRLANVLLLSLPGSPCLYYGDEIQMGDNIWLPDRDGVRTPMQWSAETNAGFSTADASDLYLPLITSENNHPQEFNVATQKAIPDSLLNFIHDILRVRREHPVFGTGDYQDVEANNPAVLAFTRSSDPETVLVLANLSDAAQTARVVLPNIAGRTATDLLGANNGKFSDDGTLTAELRPREYRWLSLLSA